MIRIAIILGSTRPGRKGEAVAKWVYEIAQKRSDAEFELVDIKDFNLPLLDEPMSPMMGQYTHQHTKTWSAKIASFDAYVFVTPEASGSASGSDITIVTISPKGIGVRQNNHYNFVQRKNFASGMEPPSNLGIGAYPIFQSITPVLQLCLSSHRIPNSLAPVRRAFVFSQTARFLAESHPT